MENPQPANERMTEHQASMTSSGVISRSSQAGALQRLPQELKDMIHECVLSDLLDDDEYRTLPQELRDAIYEAAWDNTLAHPGEEVDVLSAGFVELHSLLRVSRQIRSEVQHLLQQRMRRQVLFKATFNHCGDYEELVSRAPTIFRGNTPGARRVHAIFVRTKNLEGWVPDLFHRAADFAEAATWTKRDFP